MVTDIKVTLFVKNIDGTPFHELKTNKFSYESTVMALDDKISFDVFYIDNTLDFTNKYVEYDGVKFYSISPATSVKEGMASDNNELHGMTKYSLTFYHPMYMLSNIPFSDIAVTDSEEQYLSEDKTFSWIGKPKDFADKLNANLRNTEFVAIINNAMIGEDKLNQLSEVIAFDKNFIADALKTFYDTWEIPYIVDKLNAGEYFDENNVDYYTQGKRYIILLGLPSNEIKDESDNEYVFVYGQGLGLKNNSRTPRNNKIVTRLAPYGSQDNIPYGYPQIPWYGDDTWEWTEYTDDDPTQEHTATALPIYKGIVNGQYIKLIKHPFTRTHLMPTVYVDNVFNKVSPYLQDGSANPDYDRTLQLIDYYDANSGVYPNPINPNAPSFEAHEFEKVKPEFTEHAIINATIHDEKYAKSISIDELEAKVNEYKPVAQQQIVQYKGLYPTYTGLNTMLQALKADIVLEFYEYEYYKFSVWSETIEYSFTFDEHYCKLMFHSPLCNLEDIYVRLDANYNPYKEENVWNDEFDETTGAYLQKSFEITLPQLDFDLYACASITQSMQINMRSGACLGCTFNVLVDWEDYKKNFYDSDGNFAPYGTQRNYEKYPNTMNGEATLVVEKDLQTFGRIMPNVYQNPKGGDLFVILGISLPLSYIRNAEQRLDSDAKEYLLENNYHYYDYPLKFDEYLFKTKPYILSQIRNNTTISFMYASQRMKLYIKSISIKYGERVLPEVNITITDDVEIVLNKIGQVTDDVSRLRVQMSELQAYYNGSNRTNESNEIETNKIYFENGLNARSIQTDDIMSQEFITGLKGYGFALKMREDGTSYIEVDDALIRNKAIFNELEIHRKSVVGGNIMLTAAGNIITSVEPIYGTRKVTADTENDNSLDVVTNGLNVVTNGASSSEVFVSAFRCYFNKQNGEEAIENLWAVNDLAICQTTNLASGDRHVGNVFYWRKVINVGENYIDLSNVAGEMDNTFIDVDGNDIYIDEETIRTYNDEPMQGDNIVQLGNTTDTRRQNAIMLSVVGDDAPEIRQLANISGFSLQNKTVTILSPNGNLLVGDLRIQRSAGNSQPIAQDLGYESTQEMLNAVQNGRTIISGGHINTEIIDTNLLVAKRLETKTEEGAGIVIENRIASFFGDTGIMNIRFGIDDNGYAIMEFYNNDGELLYDLGVNGLRSISVVNDKYIQRAIYEVSGMSGTPKFNETSLKQLFGITTIATTNAYEYAAEKINDAIQKGNYAESPTHAENSNGNLFTNTNVAIVNNQAISGNYLLSPAVGQVFLQYIGSSAPSDYNANDYDDDYKITDWREVYVQYYYEITPTTTIGGLNVGGVSQRKRAYLTKTQYEAWARTN